MKRYLGIDVSQQQCALGVVVDTGSSILRAFASPTLMTPYEPSLPMPCMSTRYLMNLALFRSS